MTAFSNSVSGKCFLKIGIIGITGRVGSVLANIIGQIPHLKLIGGTCSRSKSSDFIDLAQASDVLIDFSLPESTMQALEAAETAKIPFISGTTGISQIDGEKIKESSHVIPIVHTSNFCISVHLMASLLRKSSRIFVNYDIAIIDKHHKNKKDAPSGTSLFLAETLGRKAQFLSVRGGSIPAEVACEFYGQDDIFSISHRTFGCEVFAKGALNCAVWIVTKKKPGMYSMEEYIEDFEKGSITSDQF